MVMTRLGLMLVSLLGVVALSASDAASDEPVGSTSGLRLARFDIDVTPPVGSMMAYDPVRSIGELSLRARGIVLIGSGEPIVLCAIDWIGISNEAHDAFRAALARGAGTSASRVTVHTLHQHDAPRCDFTAEALLHQVGATDLSGYEGSFAREVLPRLQAAVSDAMPSSVAVTEVGFGVAEVHEVASNRRIQDDSGKVVGVRFTATRDAALRAAPVGVVDPMLRLIGFWADDKLVAACTYFACHPQSYYRTGVPSVDFPGIARFMIGQDFPDALFVHFNGAGGNIGAGKFNDGAPAMRMQLANRVAQAMRQAREQADTARQPVTAGDIKWTSRAIQLPPGEHLEEQALRAPLQDRNWRAAGGRPDQLAYLIRYQQGHTIDVTCLGIKNIGVLHLPGELFVEYQLAAQTMRPDVQVALAAYGDYAPGYIGTAEAYGQGGYETSPAASKVSPEAEPILMDAMRALLGEL